MAAAWAMPPVSVALDTAAARLGLQALTARRPGAEQWAPLTYLWDDAPWPPAPHELALEVSARNVEDSYRLHTCRQL